MSHQSLVKSFIFNEMIDKAFIFSLYEDDYECISDVFFTSLESFDSDQHDIETSYQSGDLSALRKTVHKMKPVFGFVGLLNHQERIGQFEKTCSMVANTAALESEYKNLIAVLQNGKSIIATEYKRLKDFLNP